MKVPIPYVTGWEFSVRQHNPAAPTPVTPDYCANDDSGELEREQLDPTERCMLHPPLEGSYVSSNLSLKISSTLAVGVNRNSQVAVVEVQDSPLASLTKGQRVVAKIYDPVYSHDDGSLNPFTYCDKLYTHEAGVYATLSDLQGSTIPTYYGSFSLDIPIPVSSSSSSTTRSVRLILIEFIPGPSLEDTPAENLSLETRQQIMKSAIGFETEVYARDIILKNIHPKNIILINDSIDERKIVFLDFGDALFGRMGVSPRNTDMEATLLPGTYISPLLRWHEARCPDFGFESWVDWDWQPWLKTEFGHTAASITPEMLERFLPEYLRGYEVTINELRNMY